MRALLLLVAALLLGGCEPKPTPPVIPSTLEDAGDELDAASTTSRACAKLRALHCPEGEPNTTGEPCATTWNHAIAAGAVPSSQPPCVARASDVAAVKACGLRCM